MQVTYIGSIPQSDDLPSDSSLYTREPLDISSHLYFTRMNAHNSRFFHLIPRCSVPGCSSCAAGAIGYVFPRTCAGEKHPDPRDASQCGRETRPAGRNQIVEGVPAFSGRLTETALLRRAGSPASRFAMTCAWQIYLIKRGPRSAVPSGEKQKPIHRLWMGFVKT